MALSYGLSLIYFVMAEGWQIPTRPNFIFEQIKDRYKSQIDNSVTKLFGWNRLTMSVLITDGGLFAVKPTK